MILTSLWLFMAFINPKVIFVVGSTSKAPRGLVAMLEFRVPTKLANGCLNTKSNVAGMPSNMAKLVPGSGPS